MNVAKLAVPSCFVVPVLFLSAILMGCPNPASPPASSSSSAPTISVSPSSLSLYPGDTKTVTATVDPSGLTVTWSSGNNAIATVDSSGKVTAVAQGSTTIQASVTNSSNQTATADVTVSVGQLASITGTVVGSVGGAAVAGATITASIGTTVEGTTTTDSNGGFSISGVHPGTYTVVASATGRAGSQIQDLQVSGGATTTVHLVEELPLYSSGNLTPASVTVTGVTAGSTYPTGATIDVSATAASGSVVTGTSLHPSIQLSISPGSSALITADTSDTGSLSYSWAPTTTGNFNVVAVVYDNNNNRTEVDVPVSVPSSGSSSYLSAPSTSAYSITAETFGTSLQLFDVSASTGVPKLSMANSSTVKLDSAQANSTVLVIFQVTPPAFSTAAGIHVYRSTSANGAYSLVGGSSSYDSSGTAFEYVDSSDALTPGNTYYYKLAFYDSGGEGQTTSALAVSILPKYSLDLVSPSDNGVVTAGSPTLSWTVSGTTSGSTRYDTVLVRRTDTGLAVDTATLTGATSYTLPVALDMGQTYSWNVASVAVEQGATGIVSESFPSAPVNDADLGQVSFSNNGSYFFVIQ